MFNKPSTPPEALKLDWKPTKGKASLRWLPDDEFEAEAVKHGIPKHKDGFAVPQGWWMRQPLIVVRARSLVVIPHEIRHLEEGAFHD